MWILCFSTSLSCVLLAPLSKISWPYICGFISELPLLFYLFIYLSLCQYYFNYYSFVICFEIKNEILPVFVLSQDHFGCSRSFMVPHKFYNCFLFFCKKCYFDGNNMSFQITLTFLTILSFLICEHGMSLQLLVSHLFFFHNI